MKIFAHFTVALLGSVTLAAETQGYNKGFSYGAGHGSYGVGHHDHGYHQNPWYHTVETHTTTNGFHRDPFEDREETSDSNRSTWYGQYQRFSPA